MINTHTRLTRALLTCLGPVVIAGCASVGGRLATDGALVRDQASAVNRGTRQAPMNIGDDTLGSPSEADTRAAYARNMPVARRATRAWIGARMTAVQSDEVLPPVFSEVVKFNFDDRANSGRVSIAVIAERLSRLTNVPVRVKQDVYSQLPGGSQNGTVSNMGVPALPPIGVGPLPGAPLPSGIPSAGGTSPAPAPGGTALMPAPSIPLPGVAMGQNQPDYRQPITEVNSVDMRWNGSLSSFLDHVTGRLNLSWSYRDGVVVIERYMTENFELAAFVGAQDFKMNLSGSNSGQTGGNGNGGSATSAMDVNEAGKVAVLESLRKSIEAMVKPGGDVVLSEGSGRFTVTTTRDVMGRVREVLKHEDAAMQRQAHIQFDIYSVTTNNSDERGVDWSLVLSNVSKTWNATIKSPTSLGGTLGGSLSYAILQPAEGVAPTRTQSRFGDSQAMLKLLHEISDSAQYRPVSMIALNRQWARKTNLKTDGYLSETTPATASSVGSGAPGLKTSSIVTGDKFMVQPAILDNGTILLKFGVSLTELISLFEVTAGTGATFQRVQTPVTSGTDDQTTVKLNGSEAMVVTGLSRRVSLGGQRTLTDGAPILAGGSRTAKFAREDFLIVVRAVQL